MNIISLYSIILYIGYIDNIIEIIMFFLTRGGVTSMTRRQTLNIKKKKKTKKKAINCIYNSKCNIFFAKTSIKSSQKDSVDVAKAGELPEGVLSMSKSLLLM